MTGTGGRRFHTHREISNLNTPTEIDMGNVERLKELPCSCWLARPCAQTSPFWKARLRSVDTTEILQMSMTRLLRSGRHVAKRMSALLYLVFASTVANIKCVYTVE